MDFTVKKESICSCECLTEASAEQTVQCDITLPEYMPDVIRVLKCTLTPSVASQQISGDRIIAECDCTATIVYVCDQGKIHSVSSAEHFGKQLEFHGETADSLRINAKSEFVNYRVATGRKIEIHGAVLLSATSLQRTKKEIISSAEGDGITVREKGLRVCTLSFCGRKTFSVSETGEINCNEDIKSVISVSPYVRTDEIKTIHGKLFLRGELCVKTTCLTESGEISCFDNAVAFNQIVDAPDISESSVTDVAAVVNSVSVRPRAEHSGDRGLLDIDAELCLNICAYDLADITVVSDAYSTKYESEAVSRTLSVNTSCDKLYDTFLCRESVDISPVGIEKIHSFSCGNITSNIAVQESAVIINGQIQAECIFTDINGEINFAVRQIPFEYRHSIASGNFSSGNISTAVSAYNYSISSGGKIDVRIEIILSGLVFCTEEIKAVTDITLDKSKCKSVKTATLTVYFAEKDESIWDIARRYNTTADAILRENKMQTEELSRACKLLIPKM